MSIFKIEFIIIITILIFFQIVGRSSPSSFRLHSGRGGSVANKLRVGFTEHFEMCFSHEQ